MIIFGSNYAAFSGVQSTSKNFLKSNESSIELYPKILKKIGKHGSTVVGPLVACVGFFIIFASSRTREKDDPYASSTIMKGPFVYIIGILVSSSSLIALIIHGLP